MTVKPKSSPNTAGGPAPAPAGRGTGRRTASGVVRGGADQILAGRLATKNAQELAAGHSEATADAGRPVLGAWRCLRSTGNEVSGCKRKAAANRYAASGQGCVREAWVGSQNTFHTALKRAMVCSDAHSRSHHAVVAVHASGDVHQQQPILFEARGTLLGAQAQALDRAGDVVAQDRQRTVPSL